MRQIFLLCIFLCGSIFSQTLSTQDGLSLTIAQGSSAPISLKSLGKELLDLKAASPGGFSVREAGQENPQDLKLTTRFVALPDRIQVHAEVESQNEQDRALILRFALPLSPEEWIFGEDGRTYHPLSGDKVLMANTFRNLVDVGPISRYPWAAVLSQTSGLAMGYRISNPRIARLTANPLSRQFNIEFDLGVSPHTRKNPRRASVEFFLYRFKSTPEMAFRAATQGYYDRFPELFKTDIPAEQQGNWVAFTNLEQIPGHEELGIKVHEIGSKDHIPYDVSKGVHAFRYLIEPWSIWLPLQEEGIDPKNYDQVLSYVHRIYEQGSKNGIVIFSSGIHDGEGRFLFRSYTLKTQPNWCVGKSGCAQFFVNSDPGIASFNKFALHWDKGALWALHPKLTGEYVDSFSGAGHPIDQRKEHWHTTDFPLAFRRKPKVELGIANGLSNFQMAKELRRLADGGGKKLMANQLYSSGEPWGCGLFDYQGKEVHWPIKEGVTEAEPDAILLHRRTLAGARPYMLLQYADFSKFNVEFYLQTALFYGLYPGIHNDDKLKKSYYKVAEFRERDRPLFKKYIPLIRQLNGAGWRPLTGARAEDPAIYLERFGSGKNFYFTVRNISPKPISTKISLDRTALGIVLRRLKVEGLIQGTPLQVLKVGENTLEVTLPARAVEMLRLH